jgi:hypothetical protein
MYSMQGSTATHLFRLLPQLGVCILRQVTRRLLQVHVKVLQPAGGTQTLLVNSNHNTLLRTSVSLLCSRRQLN